MCNRYICTFNKSTYNYYIKSLDGVFIVIHDRCETFVDWSVPIMSLSSVSGTPAIVARFLSASIVA